MNKFASVLLLAVLPYLAPQTLKTEDLNIFVVRNPCLVREQVSDLSKIDFANMRAVHVGEYGEIDTWQALRRGRGKTVDRDRDGNFEGATDVRLAWQEPLDAEHWIADYEWEWVGGSSSHSDIVQVFELRDSMLFITQQIEADTHHGGRVVGGRFNTATKLLTVKAVDYADREGRCCPSLMDVATFRWDGKQFHRISAKIVPLPKK